MGADSLTQRLFAAIRSSDLSQVQQLLQPDTLGDGTVAGHPALVMALGLAVQSGQVEITQALITAGADVNWMLPETPLHLAARNGDRSLVQLLLAAGATVDELTLSGQTALMLAARHGHLEVVKQLIAAGADANAWMDGETPLLQAALSQQTAVYDFLEPLVDADIQRYVARELAKGTEQRQREQRRDVEDLIAAALLGELAEVDAAIAQGTAVDAIGSNGQTALMVAAQAGHLDIVESLLIAGANPALWSQPEDGSPGMTAIEWAIAAGHSVVVDRLRQSLRP